MKKQDALEVIKKISELEDNWDSYNSPKISPIVLGACNYLLNNLQESELPLFICPISGGSVQLEWEKNLNFLEIEISEGEVGYLVGGIIPYSEGILFKYEFNGNLYRFFDINKIKNIISQLER